MKVKNFIAATYTPLEKDGSLNLSVIKDYGQFLKSNKVTGVFVNGSTGDFPSLTVKERKLIIDEWVDTKPDNFLILNHVGHTSLKVAKELASHASQKVDAISSLPPFYFRPKSVQSLIDYCLEVASCAPEIPFYYYHIPELTGANFDMINFLKLASEQIPNLGGIKFTKNDLLDYRFCTLYKDKSYDILFGVDEVFATSLPIGAQGWVGSTYNHLAPLYFKIQEEFYNGNMDQVAVLQTKSMEFVKILDSFGGFNGTAKTFMKVMGIDCGPSRYPHKTLSEADLKKVTAIFEKLNIMEFTSRSINV